MVKLPHIHLISAYRYPLVPRFGIPEVTEWLLNAPRIARDGAPFFWTYLDIPQDGTIILTWQPLQRLGTEFASDGYVWPRGEVYYQHEIRDGLVRKREKGKGRGRERERETEKKSR